ncbi:MAG: biotin transporter BioY [Cyanobacteria bacterium P01_H01_bin.15]
MPERSRVTQLKIRGVLRNLAKAIRLEIIFVVSIKLAIAVSLPNELIWSLVGLLLTIAGTFVEIFRVNPPWDWAEQGLQVSSLGITFQIGAVLLTGCLAGRYAGAIAQIAYVLLGLFWLPVFASGGGIDYWQQPSFGYLLGFIGGGFVCGWLAFLGERLRLELLAISSFAGLLVIHACGLLYLAGLYYVPQWLGGSAPFDLNTAAQIYSVNPIPGQLTLGCAVAVVAYFARKLLAY